MTKLEPVEAITVGGIRTDCYTKESVHAVLEEIFHKVQSAADNLPKNRITIADFTAPIPIELSRRS